jgi:hypothetical protein
MQMRIIFRPIWGDTLPIGDHNLAYVQRFDIMPQPSSSTPNSTRGPGRDLTTRMYILRRSLRSDGSRFGDIVPILRIRVPAQITPRFGPQADPCLSPQNSLEFSTAFYLNNYSEKEIYDTGL